VNHLIDSPRPDRVIRFLPNGSSVQEALTPNGVTGASAQKRIAITKATFLGVLIAIAAIIIMALASYARAAARTRAASRARESRALQEVAIALARLKHAPVAVKAGTAQSSSPATAAAAVLARSNDAKPVRVLAPPPDQDENSYQSFNARRAGLAGFDPIARTAR
jgi:hypothetical protein